MPFDVRKHLIKVQGGRDYLPVAYRLVWFREDHPDYGIDTKPLLLDPDKGIAVFQAHIYDAEGRLLSCGSKMETARGFADFVEKAETGAIGRALGVLGYGTQFAPEFDEGDRYAEAPQGRGSGPTTRNKPRNAPSDDSGAKAAPSGALACEECGTVLTKGQATVSQGKFGRNLCPDCQKGAA